MATSRYTSALILAVFSVVPGLAVPQEIDMTTAIEMAITRNLSVQIERIEADIAGQQIEVAAGAFDPHLAISAGAAQTEAWNGSAGPDNIDAEQRRNAAAGLEGLLPWGMTYDLGISGGRNRSSADGSMTDYDTFAGLRLVQPLLRGGGLDANRAQIRIARTGATAADWGLTGEIIDTVTATVYAYNSLYFAQESLRVAQHNRELTRRLLNDNRRRAELGVIPALDVSFAEARAARADDRVLQAEILLDEAHARFLGLLSGGKEDCHSVEYRVVRPPEPAKLTIDFIERLEAALTLRPDYREALLNRDIRGLETGYARTDALPNLDLVGHLGYSGGEYSLSESAAMLDRRDAESTYVGLEASWPIPNRTARARLTQARLEEEKAETFIRRIEQNIYLQLRSAIRRMDLGWERIASSHKARELAARSLEAEEKRLQAGSGRMYYVLEMQEDLADAEIRELKSIVDYGNAVAEYNRQAGTTLETLGISLPSSSQ